MQRITPIVTNQAKQIAPDKHFLTPECPIIIITLVLFLSAGKFHGTAIFICKTLYDKKDYIIFLSFYQNQFLNHCRFLSSLKKLCFKIYFQCITYILSQTYLLKEKTIFCIITYKKVYIYIDLYAYKLYIYRVSVGKSNVLKI